jgi:hypothetical protein
MRRSRITIGSSTGMQSVLIGFALLGSLAFETHGLFRDFREASANSSVRLSTFGSATSRPDEASGKPRYLNQGDQSSDEANECLFQESVTPVPRRSVLPLLLTPSVRRRARDSGHSTAGHSLLPRRRGRVRFCVTSDVTFHSIGYGKTR